MCACVCVCVRACVRARVRARVQVDYVNEARNADRFRALYGGIPGLVVPEVYM